MAKKEVPVEQRKHERFHVPAGSFVSIGSNGSILGQILDVSMGGLAFRYIGEGSSNGSYLDIFSTEHDFHVHKVSFKSITDFEIDNEVLYKVAGRVHPHCRNMRRRSVRFHKLSRQQRSKLKHFLQNHALRQAI